MTKQRPRILLDTCVFRTLAAQGQIKGVDNDDLLRLAQQRILWCCSLSFAELAQHLRPEEEENFEHIREAFVWMRRLCTDQMADLYEDALVGALSRLGGRTPRSKRDHFNRLRSAIEGASTLDELSSSWPPDAIKQLIDRSKNAYVEHGTGMDQTIADIKAGKFDIPEGDETPKERQAKIDLCIRSGVTAGVLNWFRWIAFGVNKVPSMGLHSDERTVSNLRELFAWHIQTVRLVANRDGFNWRKRDTDSMDQLLLVYPHAGFTVATLDKSMVVRIKDGGCASPIRVQHLVDAIKAVRS